MCMDVCTDQTCNKSNNALLKWVIPALTSGVHFAACIGFSKGVLWKNPILTLIVLFVAFTIYSIVTISVTIFRVGSGPNVRGIVKGNQVQR